MQIPKIIMQTWKNKIIPDHWKKSPEAIETYMGDWKYVLMSDDDNYNYVKEHFPDFLDTYIKFPYNIQRADAIRYMWLYKNGGLYMDLDLAPTRDLSPLFEHGELFLASSGNLGSFITNSFMASVPNHPIWLEVLEEMKKELNWYIIGKHFTVMNSTGPIMLNRVVKRGYHSYVSLPSKLVMPCSVCDVPCKTDMSWIEALKGSSWISYDTQFLIFFLCNSRQIIYLVIILLFLLIAYFIIKRFN